jgi:1-phosphatidylinositol-3-phosphate 5-kinase
MVRSGSASQTQPNPSPAVETGTSSFFSVASGYKFFSSSSKNQPDPDQENVVWNEPETYSSAISRKENTKDSTSLLAIRDVLRQKSVPEQASGPPSATSSRLSSLSSSNIAMPSAVKSKPDIGLTMQAAGGKVNASDAGEHASEVLLQGLGQATTSRPASTRSGITPSASPEPILRDVKEESGGSGASSDSGDSQNTIGKNHGAPAGNTHSNEPSQLPPPLPPKDDPKTPSPEHISLPSTSTTAPSAWQSPSGHEAAPSQPSGFASTLASGLSSAMRYVMKSEPVSRAPTPVGTANTSTTKSQHHVLLADIATFDERPHIKYDWTIGKRLKFSCTVYYAKQFDMLRKRCGIHDVFMKSLAKSTNWMAEGGKSKSNFWKTSDDRFIIKTLVNAWNVADL